MDSTGAGQVIIEIPCCTEFTIGRDRDSCTLIFPKLHLYFLGMDGDALFTAARNECQAIPAELH